MDVPAVAAVVEHVEADLRKAYTRWVATMEYGTYLSCACGFPWDDGRHRDGCGVGIVLAALHALPSQR